MTQIEAHPAINSDLLKAADNGGRVGKELSLLIENSLSMRIRNFFVLVIYLTNKPLC